MLDKRYYKLTILSLLILLFIVFIRASFGQEYHRIKVGIVDTGLDINDPRFKDVLCDAPLHKDFTGYGLLDNSGHGTHVAGLIKKYAGNQGYCLIITKYVQVGFTGYSASGENLTKAVQYLISLGAEYINISSTGFTYSKSEYDIMRNAHNVTFIAAAGNNGNDVGVKSEYPASYNLSNVISVGALGKNGKRYYHSNYGKSIKAWELGEEVVSYLPLNICRNLIDISGCEISMSGTSMSAPIHLGKIIKRRLEGSSPH